MTELILQNYSVIDFGDDINEFNILTINETSFSVEDKSIISDLQILI